MATNVILGQIILGIIKNLFCWSFFNHLTKIHKNCLICHALRLLHIMGHNYSRVLLLQLMN